MPVVRKKDGKETIEDEVLNSQKAIWRREEGKVTEEEYREFYRHLTHDWKEPLAHMRLNGHPVFSNFGHIGFAKRGIKWRTNQMT